MSKTKKSISTLELANMLLHTKNKNETKKLLNKYRIPVKKSKYC